MGSPAGAPMQSWLELWNEWEIQAVVVISFGAQVILFFFAGIRRYSVSSVLRVFLWLVYLIADAAAIYALGHMSASLSKTSTDKHQLVAFWAPFLLLHLGGQDTITAYALEDNELWLRHLLTMSVQVAGTGYVLHKYIIADRATIVSAAVLVSVAGFVKYGERIWALKCASKQGSDEIIFYGQIRFETSWFCRNEKVRTYVLMVAMAHEYLYNCTKPLIRGRYVPTDRTDTISKRVTSNVDQQLHLEELFPREKRYSEGAYRAIEVQLAVMYDMLYTKAEVVHTWYGYLIRGISFVSCFSALVAFTRSKRDRYSTADIVITFVLLGGACALEVASAFKVIASTWTYRVLNYLSLYSIFHYLYLEGLANAILFARYQLMGVKDGRWSNSVGRYDFLSFCASEKNKLIKGRIAYYFGFGERWYQSHYTKQAKLSPALKEFVWGLLRGEDSGMVQIEEVADQRGSWARRLTGFNQSEELDWSLRLEFHKCVLIWHLATSTFLSDRAVKAKLNYNSMAKAEGINTLSDYMMYLLVQHPDILPINAADIRKLSRETYKELAYEWSRQVMQYKQTVKPEEVLPRMFCNLEYYTWDMYPGKVVLMNAGRLVRTLISMNLELAHKIIGSVWKEMLCYAATNASGDFHARQLSKGGEFLTHILFLARYCSTVNSDERNVGTNAAVAVPVEPMVEAAGHVELNVCNDRVEEISLNPADP